MQEHMRWQVGVLRRGEENVVWIFDGTARDWTDARSATIAAVKDLVTLEGRQEHRFRIDDVEGIVNPGVGCDGSIVVGDLERLIPASRDAY